MRQHLDPKRIVVVADADQPVAGRRLPTTSTLQEPKGEVPMNISTYDSAGIVGGYDTVFAALTVAAAILGVAVVPVVEVMA